MQGRRTAGRLLGTVVLAVATTAATFAGGAGTASAAPPTGPAPVRQLVAAEQHAPGLRSTRALGTTETGTRAALRVPGAADDDETYLDLNPSCVSKTGGKAKPNATVGSASKLKLDYVLTGSEDYRKTGTVTVKAYRDTDLELSSVKLGSYRLTLARHGSATLVADETFDVLPCVQVKAGCASLTVTNPAGNPAAEVAYGRKKADDFFVELAPGESRTVRVDDTSVKVEATSAADEDAYVDLGSSTVKVKQSCKHGAAQPGQNAVQTSALVTCGSATTQGSASFSWAAQKSLKDRTWEVVAGAGSVTKGSYKNSGGKSIDLAPGTYTYRSYANKVVQPFEEVVFSVLDCVTVAPRCKALDVTNPNAVSVEAYLIDTDDDSDVVDPGEGESETTVAAGSTVSIPWLTRKVVLLAVAGDLDSWRPFISIASDFPLDDDQDFPEYTVPQDC